MYHHFYYSIFIWSLTCFGRHTAYHQEPKTALVASGFSYVEGCWTCSWWTTSTNYLLHNGVRRGVGLKGEGKPYFKIYFFVTSALRLAAMLISTRPITTYLSERKGLGGGSEDRLNFYPKESVDVTSQSTEFLPQGVCRRHIKTYLNFNPKIECIFLELRYRNIYP